MDSWEQKKMDFIRRGQKDRIEFFESLAKGMLPSQIKRIQQNDKGVLKEIVLPEWLKWDTLFEWSNTLRVTERGVPCILCGNETKNWIEFKEKYICEDCFLKIKNTE